MDSRFFLWLWVLLRFQCILAQEEAPQEAELGPFRTKPYVEQQLVHVKQLTSDRSLLSPGYLFFSPTQWFTGHGPKIYDIDGLMVWDGKEAGNGVTQQFYPCDYQGQLGQHLCWHEAAVLGPVKHGNVSAHIPDFNRVLDNTYTQVGINHTTTGDFMTLLLTPELHFVPIPVYPDSHEFYTVDQGRSYVQTVYLRKKMDLSAWGGQVDGWIQENCFQEVSFGTGEVIFSWCYLDHLPIETHLYLHIEGQTNHSSDLSGDSTWWHPWDFFHINSVDKNEEGDYLICGRHNDQIIKIAGPNSPNGKPGEALWKLGGDSNQFEHDFVFARQHDARFVSTTATTTRFTMFDNAWEGETEEASASQPYSSAKIIEINNVTMTATLVREFPHPERKLCRSGGNVQTLPNNNLFVGWGFIRDISEFHEDGTVLFHAHLGIKSGKEDLHNYRNFKYPWIGKPAEPPKLYAYSHHTEKAILKAYVSWNGATEVARWRFSVSRNSDWFWTHAGVHDAVAFETSAVLADEYAPLVQAEALDSKGKVLATVWTETFVPNVEARDGCDMEGCFAEHLWLYDEQYNKCRGGACEERGLATMLRHVLLLAFILFIITAFSLIIIRTYRHPSLSRRGRYMELSTLPDRGDFLEEQPEGFLDEGFKNSKRD